MDSNLHIMELPRQIIIGNGSIELINETCKSLGSFKRIMIITGPTTLHKAGARVATILEKEGLEVNCYVASSRAPTLADIEVTETKMMHLQPHVVLGVGGGSKIDIAKLSSFRQGIPFIAIPTTASHDGIASPFASIKNLEKPYSIKAQSPLSVIADTEIMVNEPYRYISSGCADVISKFVSTRDWKLAHERKNEYYAQYAANLALMGAQHIVENVNVIRAGQEEGLRILLEALVSCGVAMCIGGSSKPCSGSEHLFSHALDLVAPNPALHGEQCGLGAIMMSSLHDIDWRLIRDALSRVGAPVTAKEAGIKDEYVVEALLNAYKIRPDRYTILAEKKLNRETACLLAKKTGIIDENF